MARGPGRLWGAEYPFERNHLQRSLVLLGLGAILTVTVVLLVHANAARAIGIVLVAVGMVCAAAAGSRQRYVRETRIGYAVLRTRDGRFVFGSAAAFAALALCVVVLIVD